MTQQEMLAQIEALKAQNAALEAQNAAMAQKNAEMAAAKVRPVSFKVSEKGALSVYGLGRFPTTLYVGQWERLAGAMPQLSAFAKANASMLKRKED